MLQVRGQQEDMEDEDLGARSRSVHYLASQYLADSSLSTDVSAFDFTGTATSVRAASFLPHRFAAIRIVLVCVCLRDCS